MKEVKLITETIANIVFPPRCINCGGFITSQGNLCQNCWRHITFSTNPACDICGYPFEFTVRGITLCAECVANRPLYNKARFVFNYDDTTRSLITRFKYNDKTHYVHSFAKWLNQAGKEIIEQSDVIIPVPLHRFKLFLRRYNQSALICQSLAKLCHKAVCLDLLIRQKYTSPQAGLTRKKRMENVTGAFIVNKKYYDFIQDKNILLVDDVITTGTTIHYCTKTLLNSGAKAVNVLTVARRIKT